MLDSILKYWYLWVLLVVAIFVTVYVWKRALKASRKRRESTYESMEEMKFWNSMQKKYASLDMGTLEKLNGKDLFDAVLANIFSRLEKAKNDVEEYKSLSIPQKHIYAIWFILEDCIKGNVRKFCVNCVGVLGTTVYESLFAIGENDMGNIMKRVYDSYDENNDSLSFDSKSVERFDIEIKRVFEKSDFVNSVESYVAGNRDSFINVNEIKTGPIS